MREHILREEDPSLASHGVKLEALGLEDLS